MISKEIETSEIKTSAPSKMFLGGEHFVVMGAPALLVATGLRCEVRLSPRTDKKIQINSTDLGAYDLLDMQELLEQRSIAQAQWDEFKETNEISLLAKITREPLAYAIIAIGEAMHHYDANSTSGFDIKIDSQVPVGAGLGSSAATAVSLVAAVALHLGQPFDRSVINDIAYEAEKRRHGNPSGADNSTATFGGVIEFVRDPKTIKPLDVKIPDNLASNFVLIDTGRPNESTGEMVSGVAQLRKDQPNLVNDALASQTALIHELISIVPKGDVDGFMRIIKAVERNLEKIGVVSPSSVALIHAIENTGGVAKICGAGGIIGATGIVLAYHQDRKLIEAIARDRGLRSFSTALGVEGLRQEV